MVEFARAVGLDTRRKILQAISLVMLCVLTVLFLAFFFVLKLVVVPAADFVAEYVDASPFVSAVLGLSCYRMPPSPDQLPGAWLVGLLYAPVSDIAWFKREYPGFRDYFNRGECEVSGWWSWLWVSAVWVLLGLLFLVLLLCVVHLILYYGERLLERVDLWIDRHWFD